MSKQPSALALKIALDLGPQNVATGYAADRIDEALTPLVEALRDLLPLAEAGVGPLLARSHPEERPGHGDGLAATLEAARAALARAEGRAS